MAELFAKATGCCKGKGGSMHVGDMRVGMLPAVAIVGGGIPIASGLALAAKRLGTDTVAVSFFGDGAANEGAFHEGLNMAAIWDLPVVFVCENNLYGASTPFAAVSRLPDVAARAEAYGMPGEIVDGNDVLAVYEAAGRAIARARAGGGPTLLECKTYRLCGHSRSDPRTYRSKEEEAEWATRDPIPRLAGHSKEPAPRPTESLAQIEAEVVAAIDDAVAFAESQPIPRAGRCAGGCLLSGEGRPIAVRRGRRRRCPMSMMSIAEALRQAIREEMRRDERVFCIGEDIGVTGGFGGAFTITLGLSEEFGHDRILDTPIAELGLAGVAVGAAIGGLRPIADVQYADFLFLAMDQIVNQAAKMTYMSGGTVKVPLVMRAPVGATQRGAQHAQSMEAFMTHVPGLKVLAPSTAYDAKGLLKSAVRDDNPVIIFEHKRLYGSKGPRSVEGALSPIGEVPDEEYLVPIGKGAIRRSGQGRDDHRQAADGLSRAGGGRDAGKRGDRGRGDRSAHADTARQGIDPGVGAQDRPAGHRGGRQPDRRLGGRSGGHRRRGGVLSGWTRRSSASRRPTCRRPLRPSWSSSTCRRPSGWSRR